MSRTKPQGSKFPKPPAPPSTSSESSYYEEDWEYDDSDKIDPSDSASHLNERHGYGPPPPPRSQHQPPGPRGRDPVEYKRGYFQPPPEPAANIIPHQYPYHRPYRNPFLPGGPSQFGTGGATGDYGSSYSSHYDVNPYAYGGGPQYGGYGAGFSPGYNSMPYHQPSYTPGYGAYHNQAPTLPHYAYQNPPPPPPSEAPRPPTPTVNKKAEPEVEALKAQLENIKIQLAKQQQEQTIQEKMQEIKSEAIKIAKEQLESEKKAEEERKRLVDEAIKQGEREARERIEAERKAENERRQREEEARVRALEEAKRKLESEAEEERRRFRAEEQKRVQKLEEMERHWRLRMGLEPVDPFVPNGFLTTPFGTTFIPGYRPEAYLSPQMGGRGHMHPRQEWHPRNHGHDHRPRYNSSEGTRSQNFTSHHHEADYDGDHDSGPQRRGFYRSGDFDMDTPPQGRPIPVPPEVPYPPTPSDHGSTSSPSSEEPESDVESDIDTDSGTVKPPTNYRNETELTADQPEDGSYRFSPESPPLVAKRVHDNGYESHQLETPLASPPIPEDYPDEASQSDQSDDESETVIEFQSPSREKTGSLSPQIEARLQVEPEETPTDAGNGQAGIRQPMSQGPRHVLGVSQVKNQKPAGNPTNGSSPNSVDLEGPGTQNDNSHGLMSGQTRSHNEGQLDDHFKFSSNMEQTHMQSPARVPSASRDHGRRHQPHKPRKQPERPPTHHQQAMRHRKQQEHRQRLDHARPLEGWPPPVREYVSLQPVQQHNPVQTHPSRPQYPHKRGHPPPDYGGNGERVLHYDDGAGFLDFNATPVVNAAKGTVPCVILPLSFLQRLES